MENITKDDLVQGARHVVGYITNTCDLKVDGDKIVARQPVNEPPRGDIPDPGEAVVEVH